MFAGRALRAASLYEWNIPESEVLEFDYTSGKRPPADAPVLDVDTMREVLVTLQASECPSACQINALRMTSHLMYIESMALRKMLGCFREESVRADSFVLFFNRVVDMHNEKVFRVRFETDEEIRRLLLRLGYSTYFPFIQPEQAQFRFDFQFHDQRLAANVLLYLSSKERRDNIRNPVFIRADGTQDPLASGIPRSWDQFDRMPKGGIFTCTYTCSPEDRLFAVRVRLLDTYGNWKCNCPEPEVMWWASLAQAPEDILEYVEFLMGRYPDVWAAFLDIDGPDGNGVISLREFEEGYEAMDCQKFEGDDEKDRVRAIFRYLDPSGEGQVSLDEWGFLDQFWKEINLSIKEFVEFCERTFGQDLGDAWQYLDADGSGDLDEDEWCSALQEVGYFGPSKPIFNFLDKDDEGTVSLDEFEFLATFQDKEEKDEGAGDEDESAESAESTENTDSKSI